MTLKVCSYFTTMKLFFQHSDPFSTATQSKRAALKLKKQKQTLLEDSMQ